MLQTGEKPCERQEVALLHLYWCRSHHSSVIVLFKSVPVPGWKGKQAVPLSDIFKSVWRVLVKELHRKSVSVKTTYFNQTFKPLPRSYLEQTGDWGWHRKEGKAGTLCTNWDPRAQKRMLGSRRLRSAGVEGQILRSALHNICCIAAQPQIVEIRSKIPATKSQSFTKIALLM